MHLVMLHKSLEKRIVWAETVMWLVCKSQFVKMFLRRRCESLCHVCTVSWYKDASCCACGLETLLDRLEPTSATPRHRTLSFFRSLSPHHHHHHHCRRGCRIETRVFTDMESQRTNLDHWKSANFVNGQEKTDVYGPSSGSVVYFCRKRWEIHIQCMS